MYGVYLHRVYVVCICIVSMCACRVSRSQMIPVLWRRSNNVDKQEMDALLDVATSCVDDGTKSKSPAKTTKSSRKRPREEDGKTEGQGMYIATTDVPTVVSNNHHSDKN